MGLIHYFLPKGAVLINVVERTRDHCVGYRRAPAAWDAPTGYQTPYQ